MLGISTVVSKYANLIVMLLQSKLLKLRSNTYGFYFITLLIPLKYSIAHRHRSVTEVSCPRTPQQRAPAIYKAMHGRLGK